MASDAASECRFGGGACAAQWENADIAVASDLSPFGVRAAAMVRDNVFKVESPNNLNFRLSHKYISDFHLKN